MSKPRIVVLVGLPGCGKSSWVAERSGVLSSDAMRELLIDDAANQTIHPRVFRALRELLKHRLELERPVTYIDATNLTLRERRAYIKLADLYGAGIEAVFFDVPLSECIRRNQGRGRVVPEEAILAMALKLVPPQVDEGFDVVTVLGCAK